MFDKKKEQPIAGNEQSASTVLQQIFGDNENRTSEARDDFKELESIKLILSAIMNDDSLESLTNLESEEIDDINDAYYLNEYFDNPRIDIFIMHRLKLSRSIVKGDKTNNLLTIFADISGKSMKSIGLDDKGIFGNRFK